MGCGSLAISQHGALKLAKSLFSIDFHQLCRHQTLYQIKYFLFTVPQVFSHVQENTEVWYQRLGGNLWLFVPLYFKKSSIK